MVEYFITKLAIEATNGLIPTAWHNVGDENEREVL